MFGSNWAPHIALGEMQEWYRLPSELAAELASYRPTPRDAKALPANSFATLMQAVMSYTDRSVQYKGKHLPAHNPWHFEQVRLNMLHLFDTYHGKEASTTYLFVRQAAEIAAYMHDCHHCGSTLRTDSPRRRHHLPMLGTKVSVEYASALAANTFLKEKGLPLPWRVFIVGIIWATTFGHGPARQHKRPFVPPNPQPTTLYHSMIRVADVQPVKDLQQSLAYGALVNYAETSAAGPGQEPKTAEDFVAAQLGFLRYVAHTHDALQQVAGRDLCSTATFRKVVVRHLDQLQRLTAQDLMKVEHYITTARAQKV